MKKHRRITQMPTGCGQTGSSPNQFGEQTWRILRADFSYSPALLMLPFMREKIGRRNPWQKTSRPGAHEKSFTTRRHHFDSNLSISALDRKSTRLNSSHSQISYAV